MIDLWQLLVEGIFGSFWACIAGLSIGFYLMFMFSKISQATALQFLSVFVFCMALGYGYTALSLFIWLMLLALNWSAIPKMINYGSSGG